MKTQMVTEIILVHRKLKANCIILSIQQIILLEFNFVDHSPAQIYTLEED